MQTTLTIDDDVLAAAEHLAEQRHQSVGEVISSLTRQALPALSKEGKRIDEDGYVFETRDGVPILPRTANSRRVTFEMVEHLKDELM